MLPLDPHLPLLLLLAAGQTALLLLAVKHTVLRCVGQWHERSWVVLCRRWQRWQLQHPGKCEGMWAGLLGVIWVLSGRSAAACEAPCVGSGERSGVAVDG